MKDLQKCFLWNFFKDLNMEWWMFEWKNYALVVNKILPFFQGGVNWGKGERRIWKIKRRWNYGAGAVLLKRVGGRGGGWHFAYLFFSRLIIFTFRNYYTFCEIILYIWGKIIFFCHHNFMKKFNSISSIWTWKYPIIYNLIYVSIKGFKKSKNRSEGIGKKDFKKGYITSWVKGRVP